jgi:hypothetical protein
MNSSTKTHHPPVNGADIRNAPISNSYDLFRINPLLLRHQAELEASNVEANIKRLVK